MKSTEAELRQELAALQQQLDRAERMTALGELLSTTTHEFNNILMVIINHAKIGLRQRDTAVRDRSLQKILDAGERAAKISQCILGLARNRGNEHEPVDLAQLVDDTLLLLEREMRRFRVRVTRQLTETPATWGNGNQLQQVLLNLLTNARQAMPEGGELTVRLRHDAQAGMNELSVRDTGHGISPEQARLIFEPFFTTKSGPDQSGKGGTGLGLATCRKIVEAHRGRLRVQSTVGKGTAMVIRLPTVDTAGVASPTGASGTGVGAPPTTHEACAEP